MVNLVFYSSNHLSFQNSRLGYILTSIKEYFDNFSFICKTEMLINPTVE